MMERENLPFDQMKIASRGVAWMMTEGLDVVLMKIDFLVEEQMMTVLPGVMQMMTDLPGELVMMIGAAGVTQMTTEEAGVQQMRTEDLDVGRMRTGGREEEVLMMSGHPGVVLMMTGVPGGAWMMTGVPGGAWMMTEDRGGMLMMTGFPGEVLMMTGGLGGIWTMIGFPDGVMTQDLVLGDHLSSQVDGERKKRLEKRVGVHLENQDHQKNVNGIETVKIERRMTRTLNEKGTERETGTGRIASEDPGMKVAGGEDQQKNLQAGEIQVAVTIETGRTVGGKEMIVVI